MYLTRPLPSPFQLKRCLYSLTARTGDNAELAPSEANPYDSKSGLMTLVWRSVSDVPAVEELPVDVVSVDADVEIAALEELWRLKKLKMRGRRRLDPGSKAMSRPSIALAGLVLPTLETSERSDPRR